LPEKYSKWMSGFDKTKERFIAFYDREIIDRALIQAWAPLKGNEQIWKTYRTKYGNFKSYKVLKEWKNKNFDNEFLIRKRSEVLSSIYYGGDAFPSFFVDMGPGSIAAYLGCQTEFRDETIWFGPPILDDYRSIDSIKLVEDNEFWKVTQELTKSVSDQSKGKYFTAATNLIFGLDIIASLRGGQKLLFDLIECPEEIKKLNDKISDVFIECLFRLFDLVKDNQDFFSGWIPVYSQGCNHPLQCDYSAMISPKMFEEFVVPDLIKVARKLDKSIYHLDGPDAVRHLDILLDIPEIDAIQWLPGDGAPPAVKWIPMLKKIQKKGMPLIIYADNPKEVEELMIELEPEGLLISVAVDSEKQAKDIVNNVEKLTARKAKP